MTDWEKYDFNSFNFEEEWMKLQEGIKKPNILVCGATGVGKSSIINYIFEGNKAKTGAGKPISRGIEKYETESSKVVLYDSEGYEIGEEKQTHFRENILGFIHEQIKKDIDEHVHLVWYCISAGNKRVTDLDISMINQLQTEGNKVAVLITQIDSVDLQELEDLQAVLHKETPEAEMFTLSTEPIPADFLQWDQLIDWSVNNLNDELKDGFMYSLKSSIEKKYQHVIKRTIPKYVTAAGGIGASPIPFSDAALIMPLQLKMCMDIFNVYNFNQVNKNLMSLIQSTFISQIAKRAAAYLGGAVVKLFPGVGTVAGVAVNTVIASSFTYGMGMVCLQATHTFTKKRINGEEIAFADVLNTIDIEEILEKYIKEYRNRVQHENNV